MVNTSSTNSRHIPVMLMESLENLKINMNILEAAIEIPETKIINLGSSCIYFYGHIVSIA